MSALASESPSHLSVKHLAPSRCSMKGKFLPLTPDLLGLASSILPSSSAPLLTNGSGVTEDGWVGLTCL